jgi:hypothetical protein
VSTTSAQLRRRINRLEHEADHVRRRLLRAGQRERRRRDIDPRAFAIALSRFLGATWAEEVYTRPLQHGGNAQESERQDATGT